MENPPATLSFQNFLEQARLLSQELVDPRESLRTPDRIVDSAIRLFAPHGLKEVLRSTKAIARDLHGLGTEQVRAKRVRDFVDGVVARLEGVYVYDRVRLRPIPVDRVVARLRKPLLRRRVQTQLDGVIGVIQGLLDCEIHYEPLSRKPDFKTRYASIYVYLAYHRANKPMVQKVAAFFDQQGIRYFLDEKCILPGDSIPGKISEGLSAYSHFLLFWSKGAEHSRFLATEWGTAFMREVYEGNRLIVVRLDDAELPGILSFKSHVTLCTGNSLSKAMSDILRSFNQV